jgi:hypothetical protein
MNSGGHRGFTVVTIVTLVFAPIFSHHHWMWKLVGKTEQTQIVQCEPKQPCPKKKTVVNIVKAPAPPAAPGKHADDSDAVEDPGDVAKKYEHK